jgi:hypothetical protein
VPGVPEIEGAVLAGGGGGAAGSAATVIENAGSELDSAPSLTRMTMLLYLPTWLADGLPLNVPELELKVAHAGLLLIENLSVVPWASWAAGVKL